MFADIAGQFDLATVFLCMGTTEFAPEFFVGLLALSSATKNYALLLGVVTFFGGAMLMLSHKQQLDEVFAQQTEGQPLRFELRKYRRRAIGSALISSVGVMLGALYWVDDPKTTAVFVSMILVTLVGIMGIAMFDMFSVGIQSISTSDDAQGRKAMIEEYLRQRKQQAAEEKEKE